MSNYVVEYEICMSGSIKLSELLQLEYCKKNKYIISNLEAKYFDNEKLYLFNNNLGLRIRKESNDWIQTLKFERPDQSRLEWNFNLGNDKIHGFPKIAPSKLPTKQILDKSKCYLENDLQSIIHGLKEQFTVITNRLTWLIKFNGGLIELSFDRGYIKANNKRERISELELELIEGKPYIVWILAKKILKAFPTLSFEYKSKVFRGFLLNGLDWRKLNKLSNTKVYSSKTKLDVILKEKILEKNKGLSFFIGLYFKNYKKNILKEIICILIQLRYIFQFIIFIKKNKINENIKLILNLKYRTTSIISELQKLHNINYINKINKINNSYFTYSRIEFEISLYLENLIADVGLVANKIYTLDANANLTSIVYEMQLKFQKNLDKRLNSVGRKNLFKRKNFSYNLITYNEKFLISLGLSKKIIAKNKKLKKNC